MMNSIPAANVGNFSSVEQKRLYDKMNTVMKPTKALADTFIRADNRPGDENGTVAGSVLIDTPSLSGVCRFDPSSKAVTSLDATVVKTHTSDLDADCDFVWSSSRYGSTREHFSIEPGSHGSVVYSSPLGTVTVNSDGTLSMA